MRSSVILALIFSSLLIGIVIGIPVGMYIIGSPQYSVPRPSVYTQYNWYHYGDTIVIIFANFTPNSTTTVSLHMPQASISLAGGSRANVNGTGSMAIFLGRNLPKYNALAIIQVVDSQKLSAQISIYLELT